MLTECPYMLCDYTPGGLLFGMKKLYSTEVCIADGRVFLSVISDDRMRREFILPTGELLSSVGMLYKYAEERGIECVLQGTCAEAELVAKEFSCGYEISDGLFDYVYDARSLARLEGAAYHTQRTNIRKLWREHESWRYERVTKENRADAIEFADRLFSELPSDGTLHFQAGVDIVYDSLSNLEALSLRAGVLYVDGRVEAVCVGYVKHEMLYIHVLRASRKITGAWQLLCSEFVADNLGEIKYVNMEDDLGHAGLSRMKMSYSPIEYIKRARVIIR